MKSAFFLLQASGLFLQSPMSTAFLLKSPSVIVDLVAKNQVTTPLLAAQQQSDKDRLSTLTRWVARV